MKLKHKSELGDLRRAMGHYASSSVLSGLTPPRLAAMLTEFRDGYYARVGAAWDEMAERDDFIAVVRPKREATVARRSWDVMINDNIDRSEKTLAERQKEALEYCYYNLTATSAWDANERGGFSTLVRQMMRCVADKYSTHEIVWRPNRRPYELTADFYHVPLRFTSNRTGRIRVVDQIGLYDGRELEPGGWMVTVGPGIMQGSSLAYLWKWDALKNGMIYCMRYALPGLQAKVAGAQPGEPAWEEAEDALAQFGAEWMMVSSDQLEIVLHEIKGTGDPFLKMSDRMDRALTILWRGGDLGTLSNQGGDVGATNQTADAQTMEQDDCMRIEETLHEYCSKPVIEYLFGRDEPVLVYLKIRIPERRDSAADRESLAAARSMGLPVGRRTVYERLDIPEPDDDDELMDWVAEPDPVPAPVPAEGEPDAANVLPASMRAFSEEAAARLDATEREAFAPVAEALNRALTMADATKRRAALQELLDELPDYLAQVVTPQSVEAWEQIIGTAVVRGAVDAAQRQKRSAKA